MASFTSSAGTKRVRPWDSCQDVEKLKEMLEDREAEIESCRKQSSLEAEGTVKKLQETLQEKDAHIEQLMLEVEKSRAEPAFGKVFAASSNVASNVEGAQQAIPAFYRKGSSSVLDPSEKTTRSTEGCQVMMGNVCANGKKNDNFFSTAQEASKMMKCGTGDHKVLAENALVVNAKKSVVRRHVSLQKSKNITSDSEEDVDCDKKLASDCEDDDDDDYTLKEMQEEMPADSSDDEEYTTSFTKQTSASRAKAKKTNPKGRACIHGTEKVSSILSLRTSIQKQIVSQMVYRQGLKYRTSKAVAEVPNLSEAHMKALLGDDLFAKSSHKGKLIQVTASDDEIRALFDGPFTKRLRYGALLTLCDGLKFVFTKATGVLKVTGVFSM